MSTFGTSIYIPAHWLDHTLLDLDLDPDAAERELLLWLVEALSGSEEVEDVIDGDFPFLLSLFVM